MNSEEIKQTNIYNYFTNNKRTSNNIRILKDKYNNELLKKPSSKKEKSETFISKNSNFKIKDFFTFKEYPEEINLIQKDLKNMHILSESNNNKNGPIQNNDSNVKVSKFTPFLEDSVDKLNNNLNLNDNLSNIHNNFTSSTIYLNNSNFYNSNVIPNISNNQNCFNNFANLNTNYKEKKQNYGISKYFPILESREELRLFRQNIIDENKKETKKNSNFFLDGNTNNNTSGEIEKVFVLDHFHNKNENLNDSSNKLNIELSHTLENSEINNSFNLNNIVNSINFNEDNFKSQKAIKEINNNNDNKYNDINCDDIEMEISNVNHNNLNSINKDNKNLLNKNLTITNNPFIVNSSKNRYQDTKITKYIHIQDPPNMKLNRELLVNVLEFIDLRYLIRKVPLICRFWNDLYNKTISSANYNVKLDFINTNKINQEEINILFKKGKNLKHIKLLKEIISEDFGGNKGLENFFRRIALIMTLADPKEIHHKGVMLSSFKLRPRRPIEMNNFISSRSINLICEASKYSLKTLILRNCTKLTNKLFDGISCCIFLNTLEISFNE